METTETPTHTLTFEDAVDVWLRSFKGEYQHRIAASYDVNPGRVNDVLKGRLHAGSRFVAVMKRDAGA